MPVPDVTRTTNDLAASIADRAARSRALFGEAARVFTSPRCVNCHPADVSPRQGDQHRLHDQDVAKLGNYGAKLVDHTWRATTADRGRLRTFPMLSR